MKVSVVFKLLFVGIFLFLLSPMVFGARLPLQISKGLRIVLNDLKIDTKKLSSGEIKFLEDALDKNPVWMLEDPKTRSALFGTSSSDAGKAYRKLFFSRLNPHSGEEMSAFFEALEAHHGRGKKNYDNGEDSIEAWRKVTRGSIEAIQSGDFGGISLNDFRALYANHLIERVNGTDLKFKRALGNALREMKRRGELPDIPAPVGPRLSNEFLELEGKLDSVLIDFFEFSQGTTAGQTGRSFQGRTSDSVLGNLMSFYDRVRNIGTDREVLDILEAARNLPKEEQGFLESTDKVFASSFFKPSIEFQGFFLVTLTRNPKQFK